MAISKIKTNKILPVYDDAQTELISRGIVFDELSYATTPSVATSDDRAFALPVAPGFAFLNTSGWPSESPVYGLLTGRMWTFSGSKTLSYSFPTTGSQYPSSYPEGDPGYFTPVTTAQAGVIRSALATYASISGLTFVEAKGSDIPNAILKFGRVNYTTDTAWAYFPADPVSAPAGGDVWFSNVGTATPVLGSYAYHQVLHEIGHALGLKHPHGTLTSNSTVVNAAYDRMEYTVMSYRSFEGASLESGYANEDYGYAQSLMMLDIYAMQLLYGANYSTNAGNTTYTFDANSGTMFVNGVSQGKPGDNRIFRTIWDGGGTDTYDLSNYSTNLTINLNPGESSTFSQTQLAYLNWYEVKYYNATPIYSSGNVYNALLFNGDTRSLIENAIGGSGHDQMTGNQANNSLSGGGGSDALQGEEGDDTLSGGSGDDFLFGGEGSDTLDGGTEFDFGYYVGKRSDYALSYSATSKVWTIKDHGVATGRSFNIVDGTDTIKNVEVVYFYESNSFAYLTGSGIAVSFRPKASLDSNFISDIQFRNQNSGEVATWLLAEDGSIFEAISGGTVSAEWTLAAIVDLDRDYAADLLWFNAISGQVAQWCFNLDDSISYVTVGSVTLDWNIAAVADYNNDGVNDILWRNSSTGELAQWILNEQGSISEGRSIGSASSDWQIVSGGDLNDDGVADILWRNSNSGEVARWVMASDGSVTSGSMIGGASSDWQIQAVEDFSFDGVTDILWRNTQTGEVAQWILNSNGEITAGRSLGIVDSSWEIAATGDYNGDGITDILWKNTPSGTVAQWLMKPDGSVASYQIVGNISNDWQIAKT